MSIAGAFASLMGSVVQQVTVAGFQRKAMSMPHLTSRNYLARLLERALPAIYLISAAHLFLLAGLVLLLVWGCSGVGGEVQAGRNALKTGRPEAAVGYLARAAEVDPHYRIPYRVPAGVLGYLGRAYLETGRPIEARRTLEKAVSIDAQDPFVPLYLGVALIQTGERERGRKEIEAGLRAIDDTLAYFAEDRIYGFFWDPAMAIRNDVRQTLTAQLDDMQLVIAAQRIGREFDEEIDKARRDEARRRGGGDGTGGGN